MLAGKLLSDAEIIALVQKIFAVVDTDHEFVLDGFPRTLKQADWLLTQVKHEQLVISAVVDLEIDQRVVESRLLSRGRLDDTKEAIAERFREHAELTLPIIDEFKQAGIPVYRIDGDGEPHTIHQEIMAKLDLV
jgi:adenylate kinase